MFYFLFYYFFVSVKKDDNNILIILGANIKRIRTSKGISQSEPGRLCDRDRQNIYKIELDKLNITIRNLENIAKALNAKVKDLFNF